MKRAKILESIHKELVGKEFDVVDEYYNSLNQHIYRLDVSNPKNSEMPLWFKSDQVEITILK